MFELVLKEIEKLGNDVEVTTSGKNIEVMVLDFEGFEEDGSEIYLDYDEERVEEFEEWLQEHCLEYSGDFYQYYHFEDFTVTIAYESFDI